jgi:cytochrome b561
MLNRGLKVVGGSDSIHVGTRGSAPALQATEPLSVQGESVARHPAITRALHWGTAVAIVIAVAAMFLRDAVEDKHVRQLLLEVHRQLGMLVLIAAALRIVARLRIGLADHAPGMAAALRRIAGAAHVLLYGLLIALPLVGWALCSAHGITVALLGAVQLPKLLSPDSELADTLSDYHVWLAWGLLVLVGMHVAAAIWHHFVRRDAVLRAMLPSRSRPY